MRLMDELGRQDHADTDGLRRAIFWQTIFQRGAGREVPCARSVAVPGATNRGTCARRTGTGTSQTTGTTTLGLVPPSPPTRPGTMPRAGLFTDGSGVVRGCP